MHKITGHVIFGGIESLFLYVDRLVSLFLDTEDKNKQVFV